MESQSFVAKCDLGSTSSGNCLVLFEISHDILNLIFDFSNKILPTFLVLYLLVSLKFGKKEKFGKCIKVFPMLEFYTMPSQQPYPFANEKF